MRYKLMEKTSTTGCLAVRFQSLCCVAGLEKLSAAVGDKRTGKNDAVMKLI